MKRNIAITILFVFFIGFIGVDVLAQEPARRPQRNTSTSRSASSSRTASTSRVGTKKDTTQVDSIPSIYGWKISPRLGERTIVNRDTSFIDFHQTTLVDGKDVAVGYLANIGSPSQSKIFFSRPETSRYIFLDGFNYWYKKPEDKIFLNTKVPYSNVFYQTAGGDEDGEQRLQTELSSNFGKRINAGIDFDYLYSRGYYTSLYNKQFTYSIYGSYIGDKYRMHAYFSNNYYNNSENGGLADSRNGLVTWDKYITNPDDAEKKDDGAFSGEAKDIPVNTQGTWNKLQGRRFYVTNKYDLGEEYETVWVNDSTQVTRPKANYVPLASIIFTTNYTDQRRKFRSRDQYLDNLFTNYDNQGNEVDKPKYDNDLNDFMSYYSFKNTLAFAMNEGFREWTKFSLTAFAEYDLRKYSLPDYEDSFDNYPGSQIHENDNVLTVGGVLSKEKGRYLRYKGLGEVNIQGEGFRLEGELKTMIYFKERSMSVKAEAYHKEIAPSVFEKTFSSKYTNWNKNLNNVTRTYIGGEIDVPFANAKISGGVENIKNHIYYKENTLGKHNAFIAQEDDGVKIISLRLDHKLKLGIFHWDNQAVYQRSSKEDIIPLPDFSLYSNMYLQTKVAKVLGVQFGVDTHFHTKYKAPGYDFVTMQFYNQDTNTKEGFDIGGFPIATAYLNLHLKNTRFFIMYYNLGKEFMSDGNSFSLYKYAINPPSIKMGLSWKFNN